MKHLNRYALIFGLLLAPYVIADWAAAGSPAAPAVPANFELRVSPRVVAPGGEATVSLLLSPIKGVKINRYPRVRLQIPRADGLAAAAEGSVGNDKAPPPGQMESNYFKKVDPVELVLSVDAGAPSGTHEIPGKLTYFYCVAASGFCAPKSVPVEITIRVK
jgi:hypothetical protein